MEAFYMNHSQNPYEQPSRPDSVPERGRRPADPGYGYPSDRNAADNTRRNAYAGRRMLKGAAGHAEPSAERVQQDAERLEWKRHRTDRDDIAAILDEAEAKRHSYRHEEPRAGYSSEPEHVSAHARHARAWQDEEPYEDVAPKAAARRRSRPKPDAYTMQTEEAGFDDEFPQPTQGTRKQNKLTGILSKIFPWKGDSAFEAMRKMVFSLAVVVVGVCAVLISSYYIDRYKGKKEYEEWNRLYEEAKKNRSFNSDGDAEDYGEGIEAEYLEPNELWFWREVNPDFIGWINIPGTVVSYPVVQKKSEDINVNTNNYYLYKTFKGEDNPAGCIFMDYRCRFDEVVDHRRIVENSGNVFIYGHNMNNRTMFGSLRDYVSNPYFYSEHPIVEFSSAYNHYKFKIFAVFVVDGEDMTSKYAFDCWNTLDFENETMFYDYVNEAKKRTLISNDVDVKYGDQLLSLYTCNGLVENGKLILMCREVRAGEDLYEGTKNATLNENVLYPTAYYKGGRPENYDPKKFVPYGPKS